MTNSVFKSDPVATHEQHFTSFIIYSDYALGQQLSVSQAWIFGVLVWRFGMYVHSQSVHHEAFISRNGGGLVL
jgi:hypothetical protein